MNKVLVISPHPDDEAIGCGGAICKHVSDGDIVQVIFLTSGEKGGHGKTEEETKLIREEEAKEAAAILQTGKIIFWREPDGKFEASDINVKRLVSHIIAMQSNLIYVPHYKEEHPDHKASAQLVEWAIELFKGEIKKPVVWMYEVWTPIQKPDHILDISTFIDIKQKAIKAHRSQCDVMQFDEAILGLNRYRGEMHSWPGGDYAEVFERML